MTMIVYRNWSMKGCTKIVWRVWEVLIGKSIEAVLRNYNGQRQKSAESQPNCTAPAFSASGLGLRFPSQTLNPKPQKSWFPPWSLSTKSFSVKGKGSREAISEFLTVISTCSRIRIPRTFLQAQCILGFFTGPLF